MVEIAPSINMNVNAMHAFFLNDNAFSSHESVELTKSVLRTIDPNNASRPQLHHFTLRKLTKRRTTKKHPGWYFTVDATESNPPIIMRFATSFLLVSLGAVFLTFAPMAEADSDCTSCRHSCYRGFGAGVMLCMNGVSICFPHSDMEGGCGLGATCGPCRGGGDGDDDDDDDDDYPTASPTESPTASPTAPPRRHPTASPTESPTESPTASPRGHPTASPTESPTESPDDSGSNCRNCRRTCYRGWGEGIELCYNKYSICFPKNNHETACGVGATCGGCD